MHQRTGTIVPSRSGALARPAPVRRAPAAVDAGRRFRRRTALALSAGALVALAITAVGLPYYASDAGVRLRSPLHPWLKPSGWIGQSAGIVTLLMFAFLWLYPLRKRVRTLAFTGSLARWLDVHIVAGLLVPLFGAVHAGWRFQGIIGLGYLCMLTVSLSGIVGRYLYVHLPRSREGVGLTLDEVSRRRETIVEQIAEALGRPADEIRAALGDPDAEAPRRRGAVGIVVDFVTGDLARWRRARRLRRRWGRGAGLDPQSVTIALRLARRRDALAQQVRMLTTTQRLFRYWHVAHLPIAVTGLLAVTVHVVAVVALGVTWFR